MKKEKSGSPKTIFITPETKKQIEFLENLGVSPKDPRGNASKIIALAIKELAEKHSVFE